MNIKAYAIGGLLAVAIATGVGWYRSAISAAEARGRAEEIMAELEKRTADFELLKAAYAAQDSAHVLAIERLDQELDSLMFELGTARAISQARLLKIDRLLAQLPDSARGQVREAIAALEQESETCSLALRTCVEGQAERDGRIATLLRGQAARDSIIRENKIIVDRLVKASQPKSDPLPWVIAGTATLVAILVSVF